MEKTPHIYISEKKGLLFKAGSMCGENWEKVTLFLLKKHKKGIPKLGDDKKKDKKFHEQRGKVEPPDLQVFPINYRLKLGIN
ncbi:MAG: hypothetical protein KIH08_16405 [Candidatus Freyarchaeota archaeon]|nr:hypothetical protein [Candidatus Jordarchaeia archaeon]MBS7269178.1 hypothetical protein [Candidatus Jordarchaeia archaeon]